MPIQATFQADFTDFQRAVETAETTLKTFEGNATKVEGALNRMTDSFSGRKIITEATLMMEAIERVGGVSKLSAAELERAGATAAAAADKMKALGMDVPPGMQELADTTKNVGVETAKTTGLLGGMAGQLAGMFTIGAALAFGKEVLEAGDRIQKMADQTGLAVDAIQRLQYISGQSGTEMSSMVSAIQGMQEKLGRGDQGLIGALGNLGIELEAFMSMNAYDQFITIGDALAKIEDPSKRAAAAVEVFGKTARELMPAIKSDMVKLGDEAVAMSDRAVKGLEAIGDAWTRLKGTTVAMVGEIVGSVVTLTEKWEKLWNPNNQPKADYSAYVSSADALAGALGRVEPPAIAVGAALAKGALSAEELGRATAGTREELEAAEVALKAHEAATKAAEAAAAKYAAELAKFEDAYTKVNEQGRGYEAILSEIDESLTAHITGLLASGASVGDLATAYSLTTEQVGAMKDALDAATAAQKRADEATRVTIELQDELYLMAVERSGTSSDIQRAHIQRWGDDYKQQLADAGTATREAYDLIDQIVGERTSDMMVDWDEVKSHSRASLQETADVAQANYEAMLADADNYSLETLRAFEDTAIAAQLAADNWGTSFGGAADAMGEAASRGADRVSEEANRAAMSWSQAMDAVAAGQGTMTGQIQGGPGSRANWGDAEHQQAIADAALAGRYFGPAISDGAGGSLGPDYAALGMNAPQGAWTQSLARGVPVLSAAAQASAGQSGGNTQQTNTFNINGTGEDIARAVSEELTRMMRVGRKWPAV